MDSTDDADLTYDTNPVLKNKSKKEMDNMICAIYIEWGRFVTLN